jgi:hypothetical protein
MRHWRQTPERISIYEINNANCMFVCQMCIINNAPFLNQQHLMHNVAVTTVTERDWAMENRNFTRLYSVVYLKSVSQNLKVLSILNTSTNNVKNMQKLQPCG